ncbi:putative double-stranded RNA/RNA-DNA hybrid binding protein [Ceratocystis lukuohia]|uniref:Double-stranded RNA/RNA-DNA hybrid binding protein n=1 Tax=Ceratocystis lukuohia TaxID=2019550 RepID=A0ABR4M8M8_9PEZI
MVEPGVVLLKAAMPRARCQDSRDRVSFQPSLPVLKINPQCFVLLADSPPPETSSSREPCQALRSAFPLFEDAPDLIDFELRSAWLPHSLADPLCYSQIVYARIHTLCLWWGNSRRGLDCSEGCDCFRVHHFPVLPTCAVVLRQGLASVVYSPASSSVSIAVARAVRVDSDCIPRFLFEQGEMGLGYFFLWQKFVGSA